MAKNAFNFTERGLTALPVPQKGTVTYYDSGTRDGLCVIVTYGGTKTYYSYLKFQGRPQRTKIGRVGDIKLFKAREEAHTMREMATKGDDPSQKRRENLHDITLKAFYDTVYKPEYSLVYKKPHSVTNDDSLIANRMGDLLNRKLLSIKPSEIEKLHVQTMRSHSTYTVNRVLTLIKHIFSIAEKYRYMHGHPNPAANIHKFPEKSRDRFLQSDELSRLFTALESEENDIFRAYVQISLFCGQRRSNILSMRWNQVDLENGLIYLPDTKNNEPMQVPIVDQLKNVLTDLRNAHDSDWVFPSKNSKSGHIEDPKRPWQKLLKRANITNLRLHDLRRSLGSYQAIIGTSLHIVGKSLGHKSTSATQVYARLSTEPIRLSMQKAVNRMMELGNRNSPPSRNRRGG